MTPITFPSIWEGEPEKRDHDPWDLRDIIANLRKKYPDELKALLPEEEAPWES